MAACYLCGRAFRFSEDDARSATLSVPNGHNYDASFAKRTPYARRAERARSTYSPVFFLALAATIASALGFVTILASLVAGG
jgi:hypothetical protein